MLRGEDESLAPRPRALARLATTLTTQPWALTAETVADARRQGLDEEQIEAAIGVISMFNYFTRVADATGIEFDYQTPLPAFEPDRGPAVTPRPSRSAQSVGSASSARDVSGRPELTPPPVRAAGPCGAREGRRPSLWAGPCGPPGV